MRCGNRPEHGHAPPNDSHPCCRHLVTRRSFQCGRATAIWSGRAAGSDGRILRGDVRRLPPLGEAPSAQRNVCIGGPSPRSRCAHRTGNCGWRASTGGARACACGKRSPTCGERACRIDGSGTSRADGAGTFGPGGSGTSRADGAGTFGPGGSGTSRTDGADASRARASDILARCRR